MNKKRIYDVIGAVIATLLATVITNNFKEFVNFINSKTVIPLYLFILTIATIAFITFIILNAVLSRINKKIIEKKENELDKIQKEYIELKEKSSIDVLTSAYNNNQIDKLLDERIIESNRLNTSFSIILVDIDNFGRVNKIYNHDIGNSILKQIADLIRPRSKDDLFIRYGGDEFLILSKIGDDIQSGYGYAERIRKEVNSQNFLTDFESMRKEIISISCGVTIYKPNIDSKKIVQARVANALNKAKARKIDGTEKNFVQVLN